MPRGAFMASRMPRAPARANALAGFRGWVNDQAWGAVCRGVPAGVVGTLWIWRTWPTPRPLVIVTKRPVVPAKLTAELVREVLVADVTVPVSGFASGSNVFPGPTS